MREETGGTNIRDERKQRKNWNGRFFLLRVLAVENLRMFPSGLAAGVRVVVRGRAVRRRAKFNGTVSLVVRFLAMEGEYATKAKMAKLQRKRDFSGPSEGQKVHEFAPNRGFCGRKATVSKIAKKEALV